MGLNQWGFPKPKSNERYTLASVSYQVLSIPIARRRLACCLLSGLCKLEKLRLTPCYVTLFILFATFLPVHYIPHVDLFNRNAASGLGQFLSLD